MPSSKGSSQPRDGIQVSYISCLGRWVLHPQHHFGRPLLYWTTSSYLILLLKTGNIRMTGVNTLQGKKSDFQNQ